ncbi:hypothetical protein [Runella aurantiaca]|uniref:DUF998 domain-containing protein n=1 Tax=Runella aurantiaca TaxID=2282308 RepID=A0A369IG81_9BACT|nr:hypothetical protein [Runella aurantiaca]RDB06433.1 hypothetical protein DVG78_09265 [Runella aurantiaca]
MYVKSIETLKRHSVLLGIFISVSLLFIATRVYPGGSLFDKNSVGFDWSKNFISNLFAPKAINGADNPAQIWANAGMIFLSVSFAIFFIKFSKKIPVRSAANIIQYVGAGGMFFTFLIVTPLHDSMVTLASTLFLLSLFYITVFILKSKLHLFKFLCIICLLIFYYTLYLYGSGSYAFLPIMQKVTFGSTVILVLGLEYFTQKEDFEHLKPAQPKK